MTRFEHRLDILLQPQKRLWPEQRQVPRSFVLYGGTGIALQIAHRQSVDFDFFTHENVVPEQLIAGLPFLAGSKILQNVSQTLTVQVQRRAG